MLTPTEYSELQVAYEILKSAYDHLSGRTGNKQERLANVDAMIILLDARALIQETIVAFLFSQGDGYAG